MCIIENEKNSGGEKMNYQSLIDSQKRRIAARYEGNTVLIHKGKEIPMTKTETLLYDLEMSKGLNKRERLYGWAV